MNQQRLTARLALRLFCPKQTRLLGCVLSWDFRLKLHLDTLFTGRVLTISKQIRVEEKRSCGVRVFSESKLPPSELVFEKLTDLEQSFLCQV